MAFGKRESFNEDYINYTENMDMLLHDLKLWGYKSLTKEKILEICSGNFSISRLIKVEISKVLDDEDYR